MTTATPLGGTTFFSLNVTTREDDFLYKSKVHLAWQLEGVGEGMAGQTSRSAPGLEVKSLGSGDRLPGSGSQFYCLPIG